MEIFYDFGELIKPWRQWFLLVHLFSVSIGVGSVTITDIFFFKFLKFGKISENQQGIMRTLSLVIWIMLIVVIASGVCLYLMNHERLNESSKFFAKLISVAVIIVNGTALNLFISPRLKSISGEISSNLRRLAFGMGSVSLISWYWAFSLGVLRNVSLNLQTLIFIYAALLITGIVASQVMERKFRKNN